MYKLETFTALYYRYNTPLFKENQEY